MIPAVVVLAVALSASPGGVQPAAADPPVHKAHRHRTPNLEMDTKGTGEALRATGPETSTDLTGTGDRSGSDGASSALPPPPPFQRPVQPTADAPRPPLQPGGVVTSPQTPIAQTPTAQAQPNR